MDTSIEYIKICQAATQLQADWQPSHGDYVYVTPEYTIQTWNGCLSDTILLLHVRTEEYQITIDDISDAPSDMRKLFVWLPRQDQLQDRCQENRNCSAMGLVDAMSFFIDQLRVGRTLMSEELLPYFNVREHLLLAMVMHDEFSKRWDGTKWVAELEVI